MRFLIIGAGALGGYYGGMLVKGGADVTFLVRSRRAAQLAERGLIVSTPEGEFKTPVKTVSAGDIDGTYDVAFLACKSYDLDNAIGDFAPSLAADGAVLPVLNGINHIAVLCERLGAGRVLGGVALFSVVLTPEGDILVPGVGKTGQTSFGELTGTCSGRCEAISAAFAAGGVPITLSTSIVAEMWAKFTGFAGAAVISTLTRARAGEIAAAPAGAGFVAAALEETSRVATAAGYPPPASIIELYRAVYARLGSDGAPSMLYDVENGRRTEVDHIVGDMLHRGERLGVEVPILRAAACNLQIYEARRARAAAGRGAPPRGSDL